MAASPRRAAATTLSGATPGGRISLSPGNQISRAAILLAVLLPTGACLSPREHASARQAIGGGPDRGPSDPLDSLVRDLCDKSVVMLGEEDHHGGGRTAEIKADLVQRLIDRCGFDAVYFESGVYEFVDLDRRLGSGTSAPEQLADAIGGLWNRSVAIDPLVQYLYTRASAGRLQLAGLDPQLGSATSVYEKSALVDEMMQSLGTQGGPRRIRRGRCVAALLWQDPSRGLVPGVRRRGRAARGETATDRSPRNAAFRATPGACPENRSTVNLRGTKSLEIKL